MLKALFISEVRINILKLLLLNPEKGYHVRAIVRSTDTEINAVRRELENLLKGSLVTSRKSLNRLYFQANTAHPYYSELMSLMAKESDLAQNLVKAVGKLGEVDYIALALPFIRGRKSTALDVDLFIVGSPNSDLLSQIIRQEEVKMGREVNFAVMSSEEFKTRKRTNDTFINRLLSQGRCMLHGDEDKFCSII